MRLHEGDQVTVVPIVSDPYILRFQRYVTVVRRTDDGYMVRLDDARAPALGPGRMPEREPLELGPIPEARLLPGWKHSFVPSGEEEPIVEFRRW